eukprot:GFKZ01004323.1.p1 GENE.GFKZ01004323.1~~GFKZ01004323.1.p1  ORF type:complete len:100 (-),score=0.68 GFKZ01004323.1:78-377(-)
MSVSSRMGLKSRKSLGISNMGANRTGGRGIYAESQRAPHVRKLRMKYHFLVSSLPHPFFKKSLVPSETFQHLNTSVVGYCRIFSFVYSSVYFWCSPVLK